MTTPAGPPAPGPADPTSALVAANAAVHRRCEDEAYGVLEALVRLDVTAATARFRALVDLLEEHMAFEEEHVMPAYAPLAPADGPGRADHLAGDHTILHRHLALIDATLGGLAATGADASLGLRRVLEELPAVYRLLATLEHHTTREQSHVYPALARALPAAEADALARQIRAVEPSRVAGGHSAE